VRVGARVRFNTDIEVVGSPTARRGDLGTVRNYWQDVDIIEVELDTDNLFAARGEMIKVASRYVDALDERDRPMTLPPALRQWWEQTRRYVGK
jgi:hypothetical protein